jgi:hypothetical protein
MERQKQTPSATRWGAGTPRCSRSWLCPTRVRTSPALSSSRTTRRRWTRWWREPLTDCTTSFFSTRTTRSVRASKTSARRAAKGGLLRRDARRSVDKHFSPNASILRSQMTPHPSRGRRMPSFRFASRCCEGVPLPARASTSDWRFPRPDGLSEASLTPKPPPNALFPTGLWADGRFRLVESFGRLCSDLEELSDVRFAAVLRHSA